MRKKRRKNGSPVERIMDAARTEGLVLILAGVAGALGVLLGVGGLRFLSDSLIYVVMLLGILFVGLLFAVQVNRQSRVIADIFLCERYREQYNALSLLIRELEDNQHCDSAAWLDMTVWERYRHDLALFPGKTYEELTEAYEKMSAADDIEGEQYRDYLESDLDLPQIISRLKYWQLKIKRMLPFMED